MTPEQEKELMKKVEKMEGQINGQETLMQQHKTEIGEARKEFKDAIAATTDVAKKADLQSALDKLTELEDTVTLKLKTAEGDRGGAGGTGEPKTLNELQTELVAKVKSNPKLDVHWKGMSDEARQEIWSDPKVLEPFIKAASEVPQPVPGSLLDVVMVDESDQGDQTLERFRRQFRGEADRGTQLPSGGGGGGSTGFADATKHGKEEPGVSRRLPGGVMPTGPAQG